MDDSAVVRQMLIAVLSRDPGLDVEVAADPLIAMEKMKRSRPDVILLDLEMPRMDGFTFLRKLMTEDPIPVVICSRAAGRGSEAAMRALDEGAVDVVAKPAFGVAEFLEESGRSLIDTVRAASHARVRPRGLAKPTPLPAVPRKTVDSRRDVRLAEAFRACVIAVGASTGGPGALTVLLEALPPEAPGLVIVQHMPEGFTGALARRLDELCRIEVKEAVHGDRILRGRALIAPGDRHVMVLRSGPQFSVAVRHGPRVAGHRPSVDVLFRSVAKAAGANAIGVILTGMGTDGAEGLGELKMAGATTIAQDEDTCVVFGMPKAAITRGAVDEVAPLSRVAGAILKHAALPEARRRRG